MEMILPYIIIAAIILAILIIIMPSGIDKLEEEERRKHDPDYFEQGDMVMYVFRDDKGNYDKHSGAIFIIQSINPNGQIEWHRDDGYMLVDPLNLYKYNTEEEMRFCNEVKLIINQNQKR